MNKNMDIGSALKKHKNQWVLIRVKEMDALGKPIKGRIIFHSKNRGLIYRKQKTLRGNLYIAYSGEMPQKGYAVALSL